MKESTQLFAQALRDTIYEITKEVVEPLRSEIEKARKEIKETREEVLKISAQSEKVSIEEDDILSEEISAYEHLQPLLEKEHHGKWVVIKEKFLVGIYEDFKEATDTAVQLYDRGPYLIRQVGEKSLTIVPRPM